MQTKEHDESRSQVPAENHADGPGVDEASVEDTAEHGRRIREEGIVNLCDSRDAGVRRVSP